MHCEQDNAPVIELNCPAAQAVQDEEPSAGEYLPLEHELQMLCPEDTCSLPMGHNKQLTADELGEKVPGRHFVHSTEPLLLA